MIGRGFDHLISLGQNHGLQNIHYLSNVSHLHPVGMTMKNIKSSSSNQSISHRVLLKKESGLGAGLHFGPDSPLVDQQSNVFLRIVLIHGCSMLRNQIIHTQTLRQSFYVKGFVETGGRRFVTPVAGSNGIVVYRQGLHITVCIFHHHIGPAHIKAIGTTANTLKFTLTILAGIQGVLTQEVGIVLGRHIATTAPTLITYTQKLNVPGGFTTILSTPVGHRYIVVRNHILYPLYHFLYGTTAHVGRNVGICTNHFTKIQEFMCTKTVVLNGTSPKNILNLRPFRNGTYIIFPMIGVGKAAARPTKHRYLKFFKRLQNILPITVLIRNVGIGTYPNAIINTSPQVFSKLPVDVFVNDLLGTVKIEFHGVGLTLSRKAQAKQACKGQQQACFHNFGFKSTFGTI